MPKLEVWERVRVFWAWGGQKLVKEILNDFERLIVNVVNPCCYSARDPSAFFGC